MPTQPLHEQKASVRTSTPLRTSMLITVGCLAVLSLAEIGARVAGATSRIERRTTNELTAARQLHGAAVDGATEILVVGNSLLLEGVEMPQLQQGLSPVRVQRLVLENTGYFDWKYGLKALLEAGSHPDLIVLSLDAGQLLTDGFRGDYSSNRLIATKDLMNVAAETGLSPTQISSLWLAHYSRFYGTRAELRSFILGRLMPGIIELRPHLAGFHPEVITSSQIRIQAPGRLSEMALVAEKYKAQLWLLLPATLASIDDSALRTVASEAGVGVIVPSRPGSMPRSEFNADGYHLNPAGARKYTAALIPLLRQAACRQVKKCRG